MPTVSVCEPAGGKELLTKTDFASLLGVKPATLDVYRRKSPTFPRPLMLSKRAPRWRRQDVDAFITSLACAR